MNETDITTIAIIISFSALIVSAIVAISAIAVAWQQKEERKAASKRELAIQKEKARTRKIEYLDKKSDKLIQCLEDIISGEGYTVDTVNVDLIAEAKALAIITSVAILKSKQDEIIKIAHEDNIADAIPLAVAHIGTEIDKLLNSYQE